MTSVRSIDIAINSVLLCFLGSPERLLGRHCLVSTPTIACISTSSSTAAEEDVLMLRIAPDARLCDEACRLYSSFRKWELSNVQSNSITFTRSVWHKLRQELPTTRIICPLKKLKALVLEPSLRPLSWWSWSSEPFSGQSRSPLAHHAIVIDHGGRYHDEWSKLAIRRRILAGILRYVGKIGWRRRPPYHSRPGAYPAQRLLGLGSKHYL